MPAGLALESQRLPQFPKTLAIAFAHLSPLIDKQSSGAMVRNSNWRLQ
jgi:hypothetical protein